ncbi:F-box/LRR-repeat protein 14 [Nymphaea thermarum]|nr:F-box/LRR-repeat protein 14 [Nymphaea thermarum]
MKKVQGELDHHVGKERTVNESDLKNLVYLQAVIKVSLRLGPPTPLLALRESIEDCHIGGFHVPAGTHLAVNLWEIHHDPQLWAEPDKFQPERFIGSNVDVHGKHFQFIPFGSGRRICPGISFVLSIVHIVLARLFQGFDLQLLPADSFFYEDNPLGTGTILNVLLAPRLPQALIKETQERNSASLACERLYEFEREQREFLRIGCGLNPANSDLTSLYNRFKNLAKIEIVYSDWMSKLGKQLDDQGLLIISQLCPALTDLTLGFCTFITDVGVGHLASCTNLSTLKFNFTPRISGCGILSLVVGCKGLSSLHLLRCINVSSVEWLEYVGKLETQQELSIKNCRAIGEWDLAKLGFGWRRLRSLQFEVDANYRYMKVRGWVVALSLGSEVG